MDSFLTRLPVFRSQVARYIFVGILTTAIYLGSMTAIESLTTTFGTFWIVSYSFLIALAFNFLAHRRFTFSSSSNSWRGSIAKYLIASGGNYGAQVLIILTLHDFFSWNLIFAATLASGFSVVVGYLTSSLWVFRKASS
jgi:putative flippase GtrA